MTPRDLLIGAGIGLGLTMFLASGPAAVPLAGALLCGILAASFISGGLWIAPRMSNVGFASMFSYRPSWWSHRSHLHHSTFRPAGASHHSTFRPAAGSTSHHSTTFRPASSAAPVPVPAPAPASRSWFPSFTWGGGFSTHHTGSSFRPAAPSAPMTSSYRSAAPASTTSHMGSSFRPAAPSAPSSTRTHVGTSFRPRGH